MKEASIKLKRNIQNAKVMNSNTEAGRTILNSMLIFLLILTFAYVLILGNMVFNIVQRKALEKESLSLANDVSQLELSYLSVSSSVDMNLSSSMGFKETKATFAIRKSLGSIKLANNEI